MRKTQSSAKACCRWATTGPWIRKCRSVFGRLGRGCAASLTHAGGGRDPQPHPRAPPRASLRRRPRERTGVSADARSHAHELAREAHPAGAGERSDAHERAGDADAAVASEESNAHERSREASAARTTAAPRVARDADEGPRSDA